MQHPKSLFSLTLVFALIFGASSAMAQYRLTNLSSNQVRQARHDDPLLVNGWGLVHAPGSPWWVADNNSGWSTLYDNKGNTISQLKVLIPTAGENGPGTPTGIVWNGSPEFQVQGAAAVFIFATLDGTISGWAPSVNFNQSIVAVNNANKGAVYTGLAISTKTSGNHLFAVDMANSHVDMFDGNFNLVKSFTDPSLPAGFAPFGIQDIDGLLYVTFASVSGGNGGFVVVFTEDGTMARSTPLIQGAPLNQPWGVAIAPRHFGPLSSMILISNNVDHGTINAFNATTGKFMGTMKDETGKTIVIDQLWGIGFGDGLGRNGGRDQLFFAAGPGNNFAGTFGSITFLPLP